MKKVIALFSFILCLLSTTVMAEGQITTQSIASALDARAAMLRAKTIALPSTKGQIADSIASSDTYIVVINYTNDPILTSFTAAQPIIVSGRTAARYERSNYLGLTYVQLSNANNAVFWSGYVQYHDIISVYISNGSYVVYDTH